MDYLDLILTHPPRLKWDQLETALTVHQFLAKEVTHKLQTADPEMQDQQDSKA